MYESSKISCHTNNNGSLLMLNAQIPEKIETPGFKKKL